MDAPLIVLLHGIGASSADLEPLGRALGKAVPGAEVLVPDGFHPYDGGGGGRQWFSRAGMTDADRPLRVHRAADDVHAWIAERLRGRPLVIGGFSQGGMVALSIAMHAEPAPLAAMCFSGRFADDRAPVERRIPVLVVHGERDAIIDPVRAHEAKAALEARGADVTFVLLSGLGHAIDGRAALAGSRFLSRFVAR